MARKQDDEQDNTPAVLPTADELQGLTPEELAGIRDDAVAESAALQEAGIETDEQADRIVQIADFLDAHAAEVGRREQVAAERAQKVEEAQRRIADSTTDPEEEPEEGDTEGEGEDAPAEGAEAEGVEAPVAVAASGSTARRLAQRAPARRPAVPEKPKTPLISMTAAAGIRGYEAGQELSSWLDVAKAFTVKATAAFPGLGKGSKAPVHRSEPVHVASMHRDFSGAFGVDDSGALVAGAARQEGNAGLVLTDAMSDEQVWETLLAAANPGRLGGAKELLAAGWCAPSQTVYDLVSYGTTDGLYQLPEVGIQRGGVRFTLGPDWADIYTGAGFSQTEAQAIAGDTKDCVEITCPDFDEVRLDAVGICVSAGLLLNAAWPELVRLWVEGTGLANEHKVAGRLLTAAANALASTTGSLTLTNTPFTWGLLSSIELMAEAEKQDRRLSDATVIEAVLPHWVKPALRADLANRNEVGAESITDEQVMKHFTDRNIRPQFVYNWVDLASDATHPVRYPSTVDVMVYVAGTFVRGTAPVVNLSTIYDRPNLQVNEYLAAFVEDGVLLAKMRHGGRKFTVPVDPSGAMGANTNAAPIFTAQA